MLASDAVVASLMAQKVVVYDANTTYIAQAVPRAGLTADDAEWLCYKVLQATEDGKAVTYVIWANGIRSCSHKASDLLTLTYSAY